MWIGATYYDGKLPLPTDGQTWADFGHHLLALVQDGAFPTAKAWTIYWVFFVVEAVFYCAMPGVSGYGKPLLHEGGKQLRYFCSAYTSFYATIVIVAALHVTGLFPLYTILDEFGSIMSVAIISGFINSFIHYTSAFLRGRTHRLTGYPIYDFFMGCELNPRIGILDFKMFYEVRIPWFILFLLTCGMAARQYEIYGYVSGEGIFLIMAHFLYANACAKAEQLIITSWDMYFEKLGFMLTFWNMAGVPFSQKNGFRQMERGQLIPRKSFPQLPWQVVKNPRTIKTSTGDSILVDGWYGMARKVHYACDAYFAICWGLITGFKSPFPWFYPVFFCVMIAHRTRRDILRCRERYGEAWKEYERRVPYLFIPYVI
ncbi:putative c-24 sterol reductase protein [Phaeoacremonium minimum UCRPA7]|uniref:Delta(24(24(1)))-sterol reductase n=1 Tax=Phaeoacremonium minimum (strain UCR-PA7) TaxID=1286976 RepID=R8BRB0_PHAM7|nr:putative c-24 sterol reductase protein [Phaeoacremonium minimum UCRPA7]EOO01871.1 putative c-24 sterol reductase protein [Phaeoacremonium minimum UCRPA7]